MGEVRHADDLDGHEKGSVMGEHTILWGHRYLYVGSLASLLTGIWAGDWRIVFTGVVLLAFAVIAHTSREW